MAVKNSGSKTPVSSRWTIWEETTKWRGPFDASDEATGRISPAWVQSKAAYLCSSNAAPCCLVLRALSSPWTKLIQSNQQLQNTDYSFYFYQIKEQERPEHTGQQNG